MPIYVYRCADCGEVFEKLVSLSSGSAPQTCPSCASERSEKQLAAVNAKTSASCSGGSAGFA